jgi:predicted metal-dependent phosphoesterase TrpH
MVSAPAVSVRPSRALSAGVLAAAITIGSLTDHVSVRSERRAGDYVVLEGDFHVHAFPGDGALAPWTLRDAAAREGLDVLALTNHNRTFTSRFAQWMAARSNGPIIVAGQEITNPSYHLIAVGIEHTVNADQPAKGAIADVHAQGGVAIAAHPTQKFHGYDDDATVATLDGTEAAHPSDDVSGQHEFAAFFDRARRLKPTIAAIGSSDFHVAPQLAGCRTFVFAREASAAGVIEAIRNGRTIAIDEDRRPYGDPRLIELLGPTPVPERRDENGGWRRTSVVLAWLGLLGMLLFA